MLGLDSPRGAFTLAKAKGIELCTAYAAINKKWNLEIKVPMIKTYCRFDYTLEMQNTVLKSVTNEINTYDTFSVMTQPCFTLDNQGAFFKLESILIKSYEQNKMKLSSGEHSLDLMMDNLIMVLNGNIFLITKLTFKYKPHIVKYLKYLTPIDYRALRDHVKEYTKFTYIEIKENIPLLNDGSWTRIKVDTIVPNNCQVLDFIHFDFGLFHYIKCSLENESKII